MPSNRLSVKLTCTLGWRSGIAIVPPVHTHDRVHQRRMDEKQDFSCTHPLCDHNPTPHRTNVTLTYTRLKSPIPRPQASSGHGVGCRGPGLFNTVGDTGSPNKIQLHMKIKTAKCSLLCLLYWDLDWYKWACVCTGQAGVQSLWVCWLSSKMCVCCNSSAYGYMAMHVYVLYHVMCWHASCAFVCMLINLFIPTAVM